MTRAKLIEGILDQHAPFTQNQVEVLVNAIFDAIQEALSKGDKVEIRGFGSFRVRYRKMREGRNPKTGERGSVAAKRTPFFKAGKALKDLVDG